MPRTIYKAADGATLPGCTTICGHVDSDPGGLLAWANKGGLAGIPLKDMRGAAEVGTWTHAAIEADLRGVPFEWPAMTTEQRAHCDTAFSAWKRWRAQNALEVMATELSLVSEELRFGGTMDCVLRIAGRVCLLDVKTGKVYPKHIAQVSGYGLLWHENRAEKIDEYHLLALGKEDGALHWSTWTAEQMEPGFAAFRAARVLYDHAAKLKRMVG
jgi:hypothetical protein